MCNCIVSQVTSMFEVIEEWVHVKFNACGNMRDQAFGITCRGG